MLYDSWKFCSPSVHGDVWVFFFVITNNIFEKLNIAAWSYHLTRSAEEGSNS